MSDKKNTKQKIGSLTPKEEELITIQRDREARRDMCMKEIKEILDKHGVVMTVDMNSALNNPQILFIVK